MDFLRHLAEGTRPPPSAPGASSCAVMLNAAARVASVTEPMQFLVTDDVLQDDGLPEDVRATERGLRLLKGDPRPAVADRAHLGRGPVTSATARPGVRHVAAGVGGAAVLGRQVLVVLLTGLCGPVEASPERYAVT